MRRAAAMLAVVLAAAPPAGAAYNPSAPVLLQELTASNSATLDFTQHIDGRFRVYLFEFIGLQPVVDGDILRLRVTTDGGGTWAAGASDYRGVLALPFDGSLEDDLYAYTSGSDYAALTMPVGPHRQGNGADERFYGRLKIWDPSNTTVLTRMRGDGEYVTAAGTHYASSYLGTYDFTTAVDGFQFAYGGGNIQSGTIRLYGLP